MEVELYSEVLWVTRNVLKMKVTYFFYTLLNIYLINLHNTEDQDLNPNK